MMEPNNKALEQKLSEIEYLVDEGCRDRDHSSQAKLNLIEQYILRYKLGKISLKELNCVFKGAHPSNQEQFIKMGEKYGVSL